MTNFIQTRTVIRALAIVVAVGRDRLCSRLRGDPAHTKVAAVTGRE